MKAKDLKNSILQMAIEGKLVPQDPSDEPASVLLERIREEKHKLIAEGKAKFPKGGESIIYIGSDGSPYEKRVDAKGRVLSENCVADEVPFDIPDSWEWARLESIADIVNGFTPKRSEAHFWDNGEVPWFTALDIRTQGRIINWTEQAITSLAMGKRKMCPPDTVLICCTASVGEVALTKIPLVTNQQFNSLIQLRKEECRLAPRYLLLWSRTIKHQLIEAAGTTTIPFVSVTKLGKLLVPIPSIAEQRRIVEQVNELMPLVEEYGGLEDAREALDAALPGRLRKSVLRLAVQGGLVPQDPTDEPAGVLLERVRGQRRQLVAEGKMKAPKGGESIIFAGSDGRRYEKRVDAKGRESEPVCIEDEIPFEIPRGWKWARLESVIVLLSGTDLNSSQYNDRHEGIPYLTGASNFADGKLIENRWTVEPSRVSRKGELLFTCKGTVGEMAINRFDAAHIARQIMSITPNEYGMLPYITLFLNAMVEDIKSHAKGVIPGIERNTLLARLVPVPPLAEESRIAEKFAELLNIAV